MKLIQFGTDMGADAPSPAPTTPPSLMHPASNPRGKMAMRIGGAALGLASIIMSYKRGSNPAWQGPIGATGATGATLFTLSFRE